MVGISDSTLDFTGILQDHMQRPNNSSKVEVKIKESCMQKICREALESLNQISPTKMHRVEFKFQTLQID